MPAKDTTKKDTSKKDTSKKDSSNDSNGSSGDSSGDAQDNSVDLYQQMVQKHNDAQQQFMNQSLRPAGDAVESDRIYTFNQTGNFLISSTFAKGKLDLENLIPKKCWLEFQRAAVFLAAMTKALHVTKKKFDYLAMQEVINGSGTWVQMTEEEVHHETSQYGASFSTELVKGLVGLMIPEASLMKFATTMTQSMGKKAVNLSIDNEKDETKLANMIIICENIFGVPFICMIMVSIDSSEVRHAVGVGPCLKAESVTTKLTMTKETYYWVSPEAIKNDSEDILKAMDDKNEAQIVNKMADLIRGKDIDEEKKREDKADADEAKRDADEAKRDADQASNSNPPPPAGGNNSPPPDDADDSNSNPPPPNEDTQNDDQPSRDSE